MGTAVTGSQQPKADINMTPMIDVLLVLIIIFMVITPLTPSGLSTLLPQPVPQGRKDTARPTDIVVSVGKSGLVLVNGDRVGLSGLPDRFTQIFQARGDEVIFVRGDKELEFRQIAEVIDIAKGVGLERVALVTD